MKNERIANELLKIAKQLTSALPDQNQATKTYKEQHVDKNLLQKLYDEYTDEISVNIMDSIRQHSKTIVTKSLEKWLKENGYEDWTNGRKFGALYDLVVKKLNEAKYDLVKENDEVWMISPQRLYQKIEKQIQEDNKNNRLFKGGLPNEQEIIKIYKENLL